MLRRNESAPRDSQSDTDCVQSVAWRDETLLRLGGDGVVESMTWTADDRQVITMLDGAGWPDEEDDPHWSTRLFSVIGEPESARIDDLPSYPRIPMWDHVGQQGAPYYGAGALSVDGNIYQYLSTWDRPFRHQDTRTWNGLRFTSAKLIYSPDGGLTWCNQDGSTPVVLERQCDQSRSSMVFFHEHHDVFAMPTFLQMGRDYDQNEDGYVYVYSLNGMTDFYGVDFGAANELVMFRVPKDKILVRAEYEYFAGYDDGGGARWDKNIDARAVTHVFPHRMNSGFMTKPSIVYNAPLGVYMMVASAPAISEGDGPRYADEPGYLGLWIASNPWGPWRQIHEEPVWMPAGDRESRPAGPLIAPKWIAPDGRSVWIVYTDGQPGDWFDTNVALDLPVVHALEEGEFMRVRREWGRSHPYFGFNALRIDLLEE